MNFLDKASLEFGKIRSYASELAEGYRKDGQTVPNRITEARLILSPIPAILLMLSSTWPALRYWALGVFVLVWTTDILDGQLARRVYGVTKFGHDLDTIVDKVLMALTMLALCFVNSWLWIFAGVTFMREIFVAVEMWRVKKAEMLDDSAKKADVTMLGKVKTVVTAIAMALMFLPFRGWVAILTITFAVMAIVLSMVSWMDYLQRYQKNSKK